MALRAALWRGVRGQVDVVLAFLDVAQVPFVFQYLEQLAH
jgi:hypothetical protein